jgi:hypothetical protein
MAALVLSVSTARAEGIDKVLFAGTCLPEGVSANDLAQILAAELSPIHVEPLTHTNPGARTVVLGVDGCTMTPSSARISVWNGGQRRARVVLLADAAKGTETRTLALALAEAVRNPAVTEPGPPEPLPFIEPPRPAPAPKAAPNARASEEPHVPRLSTMTGPRADVSFRYIPASSTPALGASGEYDWGRFGVGLSFLGTGKGTDLGTATLFAIAALASFDAFHVTETTSFRVLSELGVAVGIGSPAAEAEGRTVTAVHAAVSAALQQSVPLDGGYALVWLLGGGFASSLNADAAGQRIVGLGGGFVLAEGGVRF